MTTNQKYLNRLLKPNIFYDIVNRFGFDEGHHLTKEAIIIIENLVKITVSRITQIGEYTVDYSIKSHAYFYFTNQKGDKILFYDINPLHQIEIEEAIFPIIADEIIKVRNRLGLNSKV